MNGSTLGAGKRRQRRRGSRWAQPRGIRNRRKSKRQTEIKAANQAPKLTGNMNPGSRTFEIEKFKKYDKHKVLVISLMAGGQGLNLQEASYVFHLDRWWNPAVEEQAEARAWRFGQDMPVNVIKYTCVNTIEEKIDAILEEKQALFDMYIDDVSMELSETLNSEQLFGLFDMEPPAVKKQKTARNTGLALEARSQALLSRSHYDVANNHVKEILI